MPNGLSGITGGVSGFNLAAATDTLIYTCPGSAPKRASVTVSFCNRGSAAVNVRLARGTGASPGVTDYMEYDTAVAAGTPLIRSGIPMSAGDKLWVRASAVNITVQVEGVEA